MTERELRTVMVCQNCSCLAKESQQLLEAFQNSELPDDVVVEASSCLGQCNMAPNVRIRPEEIWYCRLKPEDVPRIVTEHLHGGQPVTEKLHPRIHGYRYVV